MLPSEINLGEFTKQTLTLQTAKNVDHLVR
jgi:hypothetical protein